MDGYFNYAGLGPIAKSAHDGVVRFLQSYADDGPVVAVEQYRHHVAALYREVATLLHCGVDEIAYIKNTTEGIIIAAESIALTAGDEILLLEQDYSANHIPWLKKQKDGAVLRFAGGGTTAQAFANLKDCITAKTRVVAVPWVHYYDGYVADLAQLSALCRERRIYLVVDAIQGIGTRALDLSGLHIDFLVCGGHKHLCSMMGSGFIYVNRAILDELVDFKVGTRSIERFDRNGYVLKKSAARFEDGTPGLPAVVSLYHALRELNETGIDAIEERCLRLLGELTGRLRAEGLEFIRHERQANIVSIRARQPALLVRYLRERGVFVKNILDVVRISFSHRTSDKSINYLVAQLLQARGENLI